MFLILTPFLFLPCACKVVLIDKYFNLPMVFLYIESNKVTYKPDCNVYSSTIILYKENLTQTSQSPFDNVFIKLLLYIKGHTLKSNLPNMTF